MHHVVMASFGWANVFVFDLLRRIITAIVTENIARDHQFWDELLLPIAVGVLGATVGIVPVHCACLSIGDERLLVAGVSGAGKSTLSAALAQCGFDYVSDDWTYFSRERRGLVTHGMATRMKLLPDAILHFPGLERHSLRLSLNGELAYEVPAGTFGAKLRSFCEPRCGIFLERVSDPSGSSEFTPTSKWQARQYLESSVERLPSQLGETARDRSEIMDRIAALPWWRFRYSGALTSPLGNFIHWLSGTSREWPYEQRNIRTRSAATFCSGSARLQFFRWGELRSVRNERSIDCHGNAKRHGTLVNENGRVSYSCKLIRDEAAQCGGREITILSSGPLSTLLLGMGTVIAVDRELREVLGFIAPDMSSKEIVTSWLPIITQLLVTTESPVFR
jgi:hypothetical protein